MRLQIHKAPFHVLQLATVPRQKLFGFSGVSACLEPLFENLVLPRASLVGFGEASLGGFDVFPGCHLFLKLLRHSRHRPFARRQTEPLRRQPVAMPWKGRNSVAHGKIIASVAVLAVSWTASHAETKGTPVAPTAMSKSKTTGKTGNSDPKAVGTPVAPSGGTPKPGTTDPAKSEK